jgi:hypothetical protein
MAERTDLGFVHPKINKKNKIKKKRFCMVPSRLSSCFFLFLSGFSPNHE